MRKCFEVACCIGLFLGTAFSQDVPPDWASLDRQAEELYTKGDLKEAIRVARLAVEAASGPKQSGRSLDRLGFFESTAGNLKDGESLLKQALELRKKELGIDTSITPKAPTISHYYFATPASFPKRTRWRSKRSRSNPTCSASIIRA